MMQEGVLNFYFVFSDPLLNLFVVDVAISYVVMKAMSIDIILVLKSVRIVKLLITRDVIILGALFRISASTRRR